MGRSPSEEGGEAQDLDGDQCEEATEAQDEEAQVQEADETDEEPAEEVGSELAGWAARSSMMGGGGGAGTGTGNVVCIYGHSAFFVSRKAQSLNKKPAARHLGGWRGEFGEDG